MKPNRPMTTTPPRRFASGVFQREGARDAANLDATRERDGRTLEALLDAIHHVYGDDFRAYAHPSLRRRIHKRLDAEGLSTISALQDLVLRDEAAMARLRGDLLISVTSMFRDPAFFRALRERVVPMLRAEPVLRIWSAGCATGEEVYSLAILLEEEGLLDRACIYGTDASAEVVADARQGVLSMEAMVASAASHRESGGRRPLTLYFEAAGRDARLHRRLLERVAFARHDLVTDVAFSRFHLVLCRNVLMYFTPPLQSRVLEKFRDSLERPGVLGLGRSESVRFSAVRSDFQDLDAQERIFVRIT